MQNSAEPKQGSKQFQYKKTKERRKLSLLLFLVSQYSLTVWVINAHSRWFNWGTMETSHQKVTRRRPHWRVWQAFKMKNENKEEERREATAGAQTYLYQVTLKIWWKTTWDNSVRLFMRCWEPASVVSEGEEREGAAETTAGKEMIHFPLKKGRIDEVNDIQQCS